MKTFWQALWLRSADLMLSRQAHVRIRTSMALLALSLMLASSSVMLMIAFSGGASMRAVWVWAGVSNGGLLLMTVLIRCGWTQNLKDPSLTVAQMGLTIASGAVAYVLAGEARGVVPAVLALILFFGTFSLNIRQSVLMGGYAIAAFSVAAGYLVAVQGHRADALNLAYGLMVAIVLAGCTAISLRVQQIKARLREQNIRLKAALDENRELAIRDALTGLLNRRHMQEMLRLEVRRSERQHWPVLVAVIDIDRFKGINDHLGHAFGDQVLQATAAAISGALREEDVLSRWGGDEFVLLIMDIGWAAAEQMLERIRRAVAALALEPEDEAERPVTVSIGAAAHCPGQSVEQTLERADRALYAAKRGGRNAVVMDLDGHPPPGPEPGGL